MGSRGIRHSREFWQEQVERWNKSGQSLSAFCSQLQIAESSLSRWSGVFRNEKGQRQIEKTDRIAAGHNLVEISPAIFPCAANSEDFVEINFGEIQLRLHGTLSDPERVGQYIAGLLAVSRR